MQEKKEAYLQIINKIVIYLSFSNYGFLWAGDICSSNALVEPACN